MGYHNGYAMPHWLAAQREAADIQSGFYQSYISEMQRRKSEAHPFWGMNAYAWTESADIDLSPDDWEDVTEAEALPSVVVDMGR